jgi:3',5'-cyclic AMP phosphodiesterase CpdA
MTLDRRLFLASSAAGLAGLSAYRVRAADQLDEFSFVIVSDTHLGRQDTLAAERQWRSAVAEINAAPGNFVLHLGDVVDSAREPQYPIYAEIRKELKKPIHEVAGNHDSEELFKKHIRAPLDTAFDHGGVRFILFNNSHRDSHLGFITADQISWLDEQCRGAAAKDLRIVFCCHVPIHTNAHPDRGWYVKPDDGQTAFYDLIERHAERTLACLHGHFHNGIRGWRDRGKMVEVLCPSVCYNQDRKLEVHIKSGMAKGFFVEELRPGYVLATLGKGRLVMRYKPLGEKPNGEYAAEWT